MAQLRFTPLSFKAPVGEDSELRDFFEDKLTTASPSESLVMQELTIEVARALATLSPREAQIVQLRFGLGEAVTSP